VGGEKWVVGEAQSQVRNSGGIRSAGSELNSPANFQSPPAAIKPNAPWGNRKVD